MNRPRLVWTLSALLVLSCLVQVVAIRHATVPGLDAVRFVRIARAMDRDGVVTTLRYERQQPFFPVWVRAVHRGRVALAGQSPTSWAASVQLAAAIPLVLAVVPVCFALARLVGLAAAVAGTFFYCLLPEVSRLGADGISDSTHLLFFCVAFWAMVEWWSGVRRQGRDQGRGQGSGGRDQGKGFGDQELERRGWLGWLLVAGVATALAALARAEVLVLAAAFGVTLVVLAIRAGRRPLWKPAAAAAACFALGSALVLVPYLAAVGSVAPQAAVGRLLGQYREEPVSAPVAAGDTDGWPVDGNQQMSLAGKEPSISLRRRGYPAALVQFGRKLADAYGYWIGALALWGAWRLGRRGTRAVDWFVQIFLVMYSLIAIQFAASEGYLVPRHLLTLVVPGLGAAGYGALELGSRITRWLVRQDRRCGGPAGMAATWSVVVLAGLACLPQTFVRHHHSRLGHRQAGRWLSARGPAAGSVLDTRGWTGLYSGRTTYRYEEAAIALSDPDLAYLVVEAREMQYDSDRSRTLRWLIRTAAEPAAEFPDAAVQRPNQQSVLVLRWYPERFRRQVVCRPANPRTKGNRHAWTNPNVHR